MGMLKSVQTRACAAAVRQLCRHRLGGGKTRRPSLSEHYLITKLSRERERERERECVEGRDVCAELPLS